MSGTVPGERVHGSRGPISVKGTGGKSGGCVRKAVELTWGDALQVAKT